MVKKNQTPQKIVGEGVLTFNKSESHCYNTFIMAVIVTFFLIMTTNNNAGIFLVIA